MGLINLICWAVGVLLVVVGYTRPAARGAATRPSGSKRRTSPATRAGEVPRLATDSFQRRRPHGPGAAPPGPDRRSGGRGRLVLVFVGSRSVGRSGAARGAGGAGTGKPHVLRAAPDHRRCRLDVSGYFQMPGTTAFNVQCYALYIWAGASGWRRPRPSLRSRSMRRRRRARKLTDLGRGGSM